MNVYIITSNYFNTGLFGVYSTVKRARIVLENFFAVDDDIVAFEDLGDYCYQFTTANGAVFGAEICWDVVDAEFVEGMLKEDE